MHSVVLIHILMRGFVIILHLSCFPRTSRFHSGVFQERRMRPTLLVYRRQIVSWIFSLWFNKFFWVVENVLVLVLSEEQREEKSAHVDCLTWVIPPTATTSYVGSESNNNIWYCPPPPRKTVLKGLSDLYRHRHLVQFCSFSLLIFSVLTYHRRVLLSWARTERVPARRRCCLAYPARSRTAPCRGPPAWTRTSESRVAGRARAGLRAAWLGGTGTAAGRAPAAAAGLVAAWARGAGEPAADAAPEDLDPRELWKRSHDVKEFDKVIFSETLTENWMCDPPALQMLLRPKSKEMVLK